MAKATAWEESLRSAMPLGRICVNRDASPFPLIPAKAGIQRAQTQGNFGILAFAGMSGKMRPFHFGSDPR
jgi:hypothetical protein